MKQITTGDTARLQLLAGVQKLANVVGATLGPRGRNVILSRPFADPPFTITKDGVTVARDIFLPHAVEDFGAQAVKQAAGQTGDTAGDGTTTSTWLAFSIFRLGLEAIKDESPSTVIASIRHLADKVIEQLKARAVPVKTLKTLQHVANISTNGDEELGNIIAKTLHDVGLDGAVTIEESKTLETYADRVNGTQIRNGFISSRFINVPETQRAEYNDCLIFLYDREIQTAQEVFHLLSLAERAKKPLLIVCGGMKPEALNYTVNNKMRAGAPVVAVRAAGAGLRRTEILYDIAAVTDGTAFIAEGGFEIDKAEIAHFGKCERVIVDQFGTLIVGGKGNPEERIEQVKQQIKAASSKYVKDAQKERLATLLGGVAVIYVGAQTDMERKERLDRADDALNATKAAMEEGIVPGGGIALKRLGDMIQSDVSLGSAVLATALQQPFLKIMENAEIEYDLNTPLPKPFNVGIDARTGEVVDLVKAGIIDPVKVTRVALQNAVSIGTMLLTTECTVHELPGQLEKNDLTALV